MREPGIQGIQKRKFKVTTDSNHNLPVAENILNRDFGASRPNRIWVSDITYINTGEGWLYLAAVMDLCSKRIPGVSPNTMTKLRRDEPVMLNVLDKICDTLGSNSGDVMDYVPDKERSDDS